MALAVPDGTAEVYAAELNRLMACWIPVARSEPLHDGVCVVTAMLVAVPP